MSSGGKIADAGWFYHAPAKPKQGREQVALPPASQIPGLSDLTDQPFLDQPRALLKESDSPYIRLAKTGGRPDLLRMRSPKAKPDQAVGYPRVDWFYLDDNALEDQAQQDEEYCFMLPDYMVHTAANKNKTDAAANGSNYTPNRLPYAFDKKTVFDREGNNATDKRVAIPEARPTGYGVRSEKQHGKSVKYPVMQQERGRAPEAQLDKGKHKVKPMQTNDADKTIMGKVLSYGYGHDWQEDREKWVIKQKPQKKDKFEVSEYQSSMLAGTPPVRSAQGQRMSSASSNRSRKQVSESKKESKESKNKSNSEELFKLSKFKSVAARTDHSLEPFLGSKMSTPWATDNQSGDQESSRAGKKTFDSQNQRQAAPFATGYPETREDTPGKRPGKKRYDEQDSQHAAPFAKTAESPFQQQERQDHVVVNNEPPSRAQPIKPVDNSNVFGFGPGAPADSPSKAGRRQCGPDQHQEAPFATNAELERNGANTPRSAGGRRQFDAAMQQKPAPFAMDDGKERFKNVPAKTNSNRQQQPETNGSAAAGAKQSSRNVPPPNSQGAGVNNRSVLTSAPFAMNDA